MKTIFPTYPLTVFKGYGIKKYPLHQQLDCQYAGVLLAHVPSDVPSEGNNSVDLSLTVDLYRTAISHPPPSIIVLIARDADYAIALKKLKERGHTTILVHPDKKDISPTLAESCDYSIGWGCLYNKTKKKLLINGCCQLHPLPGPHTTSSPTLLVKQPLKIDHGGLNVVTLILWDTDACPVDRNAVTWDVIKEIKSNLAKKMGLERVSKAKTRIRSYGTHLPSTVSGSLKACGVHHTKASHLKHETVKNPSSTHDSVPMDWFTARKKQVFVDSGIRVMFVGSVVLASLVRNGSMDEIKDVLEKGDPSWHAVDAVADEGQTLLHLAISQGRADLVQLLLEFEPDIEAHGSSGVTPLEAASASGEGLIVELLLAHRASTERLESSTWGPLHLATSAGHVNVLRLLLQKGANANMLTRDGNTALHMVVEERKRDCARLLLASDAQPNIRNSGDGDTSLHIPAAFGNEYMVKLLLQKGAYKEIQNHSGKTAYDMAAEQGHTKLFDALGLGDMLCIAARKGEIITINRLLESGALVNGQDQHG